jgi:hypothetical protein
VVEVGPHKTLFEVRSGQRSLVDAEGLRGYGYTLKSL